MSRKRELRSALESYYKSLSTVLLTTDEEEYYASIIQDGDEANPSEDVEDAVEIMWEHNLRLVVKIAMSMGKELDGMCPNDAVAWGRIGLRRAVWKYDPSFENKFSTYARHWIYKEIRDAVNTKGNSSGYVSIPASAASKARRVGAAMWKFSAENGREPTVDELVELTGIAKGSMETLVRVSGWKRTQVDYMGISDHSQDDAFKKMETDGEISHMRRAMSKLTHQEATVLILRQGLDGQPIRKLDDVGIVVGLTGERVRQIQNDAMIKLRELMKGENVNDETKEIDYIKILQETS